MIYHFWWQKYYIVLVLIYYVSIILFKVLIIYLRDLVPFVLFKKLENTYAGVLLLKHATLLKVIFLRWCFHVFKTTYVIKLPSRLRRCERIGRFSVQALPGARLGLTIQPRHEALTDLGNWIMQWLTLDKCGCPFKNGTKLAVRQVNNN